MRGMGVVRTGAVFSLREIAAEGALRENAVAVRMLALCPMLAVTVSFSASFVLGLLTAAVMTAAGAVVSVLRGTVPLAVRLPVFLIIVASLVGAADVFAAAFFPDLHRRLDIFLPLIVTNCAVLARLELFARREPPLAAAADGFFTGLGMTVALCVLALAREFLGSGGIAPLPPLLDFAPLPSALLPAAGFVLFGFFIALLRLCKIKTG